MGVCRFHFVVHPNSRKQDSFFPVCCLPSSLLAKGGQCQWSWDSSRKRRSSPILINGAAGEGVVVRKKKTLRVESPDELEGDIDWGERQQKVNRECQRVW